MSRDDRAEPPTLCLVAKEPGPGRVKTRLAENLGPETACELYEVLLDRQIRAVPHGWRKEVHFDPLEASADFSRRTGGRWAVFPQVSGGLGERLEAIAGGAFDRGAKQVLLIGADCPDLSEAVLESARDRLDDHDAVIIPAADGGFVLLGLTTFDATLFSDVAWSTEVVCQQVCDRMGRLGWRFEVLPALADIDTLVDLQKALETDPELRAMLASRSISVSESATVPRT